MAHTRLWNGIKQTHKSSHADKYKAAFYVAGTTGRMAFGIASIAGWLVNAPSSWIAMSTSGIVLAFVPDILKWNKLENVLTPKQVNRSENVGWGLGITLPFLAAACIPGHIAKPIENTADVEKTTHSVSTTLHFDCDSKEKGESLRQAFARMESSGELVLNKKTLDALGCSFKPKSP